MSPATTSSRGTVSHEPRCSLTTISRALRFGRPVFLSLSLPEQTYAAGVATLVASVKESIEEVLPRESPRREKGGAKYFLYDRCDGACMELDIWGGVDPFWYTFLEEIDVARYKTQRADDLRPHTRLWSQPNAGFVALHDNTLPVTVLAFDMFAWSACKHMSVSFAIDNPGQENEMKGMPDDELAKRLVRDQMEMVHQTDNSAFDFGTPRMSSVAALIRSMVRRNCMVCGTASPLKCQGCKVMGFCSVACQRKGWKAHKDECPLIARIFGSIKSETGADGRVTSYACHD